MSSTSDEIFSVRQNANRLPCLDGLRAVAVGLVIAGHGWYQIGLQVPDWFKPTLQASGALGVELFFGLSGFLITHLLCREFAREGHIDLGYFYLRRALRILPPLFLFLGVVALLNLAGILHVQWKEILAGLFFFRNYLNADPATDSWYVGHLWSLSMEEQFYLALPFTLACLGPRKTRRVILLVALAMPLVRVGSYFLFPSVRSLIVCMFHSSADRILWGSLLALYGHTNAPLPWTALYRSRSAFVAVVTGFFFLLPYLEKLGGAPYFFIAGLSLRALSVVFIIDWLAHNAKSSFAVFLNTRAMKTLGLLSYSIYLWQQLFVGERPHFFNGLFPAALMACIVAGALSYSLTEVPFIGLRRRLQGHHAKEKRKSSSTLAAAMSQ